ncbi:MAG: DUF58 domain-containing protein [Acidimicrobiia bacterium]|nr:DUF58 domain-containing protein [Acidimicrobiia bacterium]
MASSTGTRVPTPAEPRMRRLRSPVAFTPRGVGVLLVGIAFLVAAWAVDMRNLFVVGVTVMLYLVVWLVVMAVLPAGIELQRQVTPNRVRSGDAVRVVYSSRVANAWLFPVGEIVEVVQRSGRDAERLTLSGSTANRRVAIDLPALPRGVHQLGPTSVSRTDPTALFTHRYLYATADPVIVWPRTVAVGAALAAAGLDGSAASDVVAPGGFDFRGLREFVPGDDPRRIHWASSAKRGTFVVKETDPDSLETVTLVLDCRAGAYPDLSSFEVAACAAASAVEALAAIGWQVELVLGMPGAAILDVDAPAMLGQAMDRLAYAEPVPGADAVTDVVDAVRQTRAGPLIVCGGLCDEGLFAALTGPLRRRGPQLLVFTGERVREAGSGANPWLGRLARPGRSVALPSGFEDLSATWAAAAAAAHGGSAAAARAGTAGRRA